LSSFQPDLCESFGRQVSLSNDWLNFIVDEYLNTPGYRRHVVDAELEFEIICASLLTLKAL